MSYHRLAPSALLALVFVLATAAVADAQVCMGLPTSQGQMSLQADVATTGSDQSFGARLGMNFNTEYTLDFAMRRPTYEHGNGLVVSAGIGYEAALYQPPVCFTLGVRHERVPGADGDDSGTTLIPIGVGIGKSLGSSRGLSFSLFAMPEYMIVANPAPEGDFDSFWDELGKRSEGRGIVGLLLGTPFIYTTGSVEVSTRNDLEPTFQIGVGVVF